MRAPFQLAEGIHVEFFDTGALVLDADGTTVHRIEGDGVEVLRLVTGDAVTGALPDAVADAAAELVELGVLVAPAGWSRRRVIGAAGAAAGAMAA